MSGTKINWSIYQLPCGPEDTDYPKKRIFQAPKDETLKQYARLREEQGPLIGLCVTDHTGEPVFACS